MPEANHNADDRGDGNPSLSSRLIKVEPDEIGVLLWSCAYFFFLLCGYYILKPLREAMGALGGVENLKWLYLGTLCGMLVASVAFAALTTRMSRSRFIPYAYRFFGVNLLIFFALRTWLPARNQVHLGRIFFVWVSVYNLFVVSVFWSFMADLFTNRQGKRLFAFIAVGGTLGQICGSWIQLHFADKLGATNLILVSVALLEAACWCVHRLNARARVPARRDSEAAALGGDALTGLRHVIRSWYLLGIALFMFCYTISSTFLYITKLEMATQLSADQDVRVEFFAGIDFWTGVLTVLAQVFLTSRLIARLGIGLTLGVLPVITLLGFAALGYSFLRPELLATVWVLVLFEAIRRATNYAVSRPSREVLYTVLSRQDKYKSKNFIDTFVYRVGDQIGVWAQAGLAALHWSAAAISLAVVPLAAGWFVVSLLLGRRQRELAAAQKR